MLSNYLKIALRTLWKHRGYTLINVTGLAVGMACCVLILLFIQHELRFDRHHAQADAIYRVTMDLTLPGAEFQLATTMAPLGPTMVTELPEVRQSARLSRPQERLVAIDDVRFYEDAFYFADTTIFDVFSFEMHRGNPATALADPFSLIITEKVARTYFGEQDPIGRTVRVDDAYDFTITGVLATPPRTSHLQFDFLAPFDTQEAMGENELTSWTGISAAHTYVVIPDHRLAVAVEDKLPDLLGVHLEDEEQDVFALHLQPLNRVHLYSDFANEDGVVRDVQILYVFASVALLILLIAAINFVNLATARSAKRAREVGMRKVMGAVRGQLIRQFLGESLLLAAAALLLALALIEALLPGFSALMEVELHTQYGRNALLLAALMGVTLFVGVVAGVYPAFVLSAFQPIQVLKGRTRRGLRGEGLRKGLVVLQFAIAVVLIIGSVVMSSQMAYFVEKDLGFRGEQVVIVPLRDAAVGDADVFKETLLAHPGVTGAAAASAMPGQNSYSLSDYRPEGATDDEGVGLRTLFFDADMVETFGFELVAGRGFSEDIPSDTAGAAMINEATAGYLGWADPLGKTLETDDRPYTVVGVLKDMHYSSLQQKIEPVVVRYDPDVMRFLAVRLQPEDMSGTLAFLQEEWQRVAPAYPFEYRFVSDEYALSYDSTRRQSRMIQAFTLLAIVVACLGLFGLVAYTTELRTKEIGIRKVLGATVPGILSLLARDFIKLVVIAFVVAAPLAYVVMDQWLSDFAYRIDISWPIFLGAGLTALAVTVVTVGYQATRAALADPVKSLRYE